MVGAGNVVTNSAVEFGADEIKTAGSENPNNLSEAMRTSIKNANGGGAASVIGNGNIVDSSTSVSVVGAKNEVYNTKNAQILASNRTIGTKTPDTTSTGDATIKVKAVENSVIIGSASVDSPVTTTKSNVTILGYNANAEVDNGVALGSESVARTGAGDAGYDPTTGRGSRDNSIAWTATRAAVSIGNTDEKVTDKVTRQLTGLAAGTNDTDAVNVAQLKSLQSGLTEDLTGKGLKFAANSGDEHTAKLGSTVKIQGTDKKDGHEYTADNLTTEIDGSGNITILMDKNISADKIAVNGKDGKDAVSIAGKDGVGHIGLTGPAGTNGKNGADGKPGTSIDISVKNGYDGAAGTDGKDGIKGANGVDGTSLTRVVYTDQTGEHQVATMEDGLKFKGDDETVIAKKLNNQLDIIGGAAGTLTDGNIGVKSTTDGKLKVQLAQDLTKITSISNQTTTGAGDQAKTTGARIDLGSDGTTTISGGDVNVSGNKITHVGSGIEAEKDGKYAVTDANKSNAANIGDVDHMVNQAVGKLSNDTKVDLARKANVDASNLTADDVTKWQEKLGNGKVESGNTGLVTGDTVFKAVDTKANRDGSNLTDKEANSFSEKIARGEVKAGENRAVSGDAVSQAISKVTGDMNTKLDGKANTSLDNITDTGKNVIRDLAKGSVKVIDGTNTTVTTVEGKGEKPTTYAVNVEGKGTVTSGNTGLISGGTAYTELRPADGSYVKQSNTTASNLTALDTQLKTTSDLIHTNAKGDAIQIGGDSTATKIDISGKDKNGKSTGRVITGVVSDVNDPNSAANVGYVNGITSASNEQIYHDMNMQYNHVENDISRAAAGSNALAALHPMQEFDPDDKAQFALGYGHYRNSNAGAVGAFYQPDENSMVNFGVSFGNGDAGINAGVTFKFGPGGSGHHALTKTQMAKVIDAQSKEIDELKKDNADKDKRIDALEQKMTEILAKLDKSKD